MCVRPAVCLDIQVYLFINLEKYLNTCNKLSVNIVYAHAVLLYSLSVSFLTIEESINMIRIGCKMCVCVYFSMYNTLRGVVFILSTTIVYVSLGEWFDIKTTTKLAFFKENPKWV